MRTKTLLCLAALTAAGVATSMAQSNVYSLNVVGYINIPVPANTFILIGQQLNTTNNTLAGVIPSTVPGATAQFFQNGGITAFTFDDVDGWTPNGNSDLSPGLGCYFKSPSATTITFVGEVRQGSLTNTLPHQQFVVRSSIVPQQGTPTTLVIPPEPGDSLQTYAGGFTAYTFDDVDGWTPSEPTINVGQGFFYRKQGTNTQWIRNFTVQ